MKLLLVISLVLLSNFSWAESLIELKAKDRIQICEVENRGQCVVANRPLRDVQIELNYSDRGRTYLADEPFEDLRLKSFVRVEKNILYGEEICKITLYISWSQASSTWLATDRFFCEELESSKGHRAQLTATTEHFKYTYEASLFSKDTSL